MTKTVSSFLAMTAKEKNIWAVTTHWISTMNKHLFRLIFNKAYGFLIPVSEIAKSHAKSASGVRARAKQDFPCEAREGLTRIARKLLPVMAFLGISMLTIPTAFANIIADPTALPHHQPHITQTANGIPQVNIQAPSAAGVSRNVYKQFDVNKPGAILNNAKNNIQTQQGGWIEGNANLKNGTARIILNEVNSSKPSQLRGYIEVAGDRAQVVIANPAGITCDGCGFINAHRGTLTTGKPVLNGQGNIENYQVQSGTIRIEGAGFDGRDTNTSDLISRATQIDAAIQANQLNITVGTQAVNIEGTPIYLLPPKEGETKPEVAVDVSSKGGMHVGKVLLTISTDVVDAMRNQGYMTATDDFVLTADGNIVNANQISAGKNLKISGKNKIQNTATGTIYAKGDLVLEANNDIENDGILASDNNTTLTSQSQMRNNGTVLAKQNVQLQAKKQIHNQKNGVIASSIHTTLNTEDAFINDGTISSTGNSTLTAQGDIQNTGRVDAAENIVLNTAGQLYNSGIFAAQKQLTSFSKTGLQNTATGTIYAKGDIFLETSDRDRDAIHAFRAVPLPGIENLGMIASDTNTTLTSKNSIRNNGTISAKHNLQLNAQANINNQKDGVMVAGIDALLTAQQLFLNDGLISTTNNTTINAQAGIQNTGLVYAQQHALLTTQGDIYNAGTLAASGNTTLSALGATSKITSTSQGSLAAGTNMDGSLRESGDLVLHATQSITSNGKNLSGGDQYWTSSALNIDNSITKARNLTFGSTITPRTFNARNAVLVATKHISARANDIDISNAQLVAENIDLTADENLTGTNAEITATGNLTASGQSLDFANTKAIANQINLVSSKNLGLKNIRFAAKNDIVLNSAARLDLTDAQLDAQNFIFSAGNNITANNAIFVAAQNLTAQASDINFINTKASAKNMHLRTLVGNLDATTAQLVADENLTLDVAQDLITRKAQILANQININAENTDNTEGQIFSNASFNLNVKNTLNNTAGLLASIGDMNVNVAQHLINVNGTLNSSGNLLLTIGKLGGRTQNMLPALRNTNGTIFSGKSLTLNTDSLISEGNFLSQGDINISLTQDYTHTGGSQISASGNLTFVTLGKFVNTAQLLAGNTLILRAYQIDNTLNGAFIAKNTWLNATDTFTNRGLVDGANTLIQAGSTLHNLGTGRIYGNDISLGANTLINDVENTTAGTAGNTAAAVIAARHQLNIGATSITNREHALIFSAGDMTIGGSLNIFPGSANGFPGSENVFPGSADGSSAFSIIGAATTLNNNSATIEAKGNLSITSQQINNTNEHFATQNVLISKNDILEGQLKGSPTRYAGSQIRLVQNDRGVNHLETPGGTSTDFYLYRFTRAIHEDQILQSDPGKILSGGKMHIVANNLLNDKSQIIAGGDLIGEINTLNNIEAKGQRTIRDTGTIETYWYEGNDENLYDKGAYTPADKIETLTLLPATFKGNTSHEGSGHTNDPIQEIPGVIGNDPTAPPIVIRTGGVNTKLPDNSLFIIKPAPTPGTNPNLTPIAQPGDVNLTAPPKPYQNYIVETDPQFASYKKWLGSDYMLSQLNMDSGMLQLRLGDGFYEQQLLREQINQLTGRQFLENYSDEEEQFQALMDSGLEYAKEWNLIPGIALTADQMSRLTSDIVWLVEKDITMPDGSIQKALVPQLYARVKPGEITGDNALISGKNVQLALTGDLVNKGTISSSNKLTLLAENIQNLKGRITATDTTLYANTDLNNLGGRLEAIHSLTALAGRDLTIASTTQSSTSSQGSRTNIDSVGSVVVGGFAGSADGSSANLFPGSADGSSARDDKSSPSITLAAGRDVNLNAAFISNTNTMDRLAIPADEPSALPGKTSLPGNTIISAGNNINLGTVVETQQQNNTFDADNWLKQSSKVDVGTVIQTTSDIKLVAGNDINAKAASITINLPSLGAISEGRGVGGEGKLTLAAANNINITTGENYQTQDSASKSTRSGFLSSETITNKDSLQQNQNIASNFSAEATTIQAGNNINITGSNVVSTFDTNLIAGNNLSINAAYDTFNENHQKTTKKSGVLAADFIHGITEVGVQKETKKYEGNNTTAVGSTIGSLSGNINLIAANAYQQIGSNVLTPTGDINVLAKTIDIQDAQNTSASREETKFEKTSITKTTSSPISNAIKTAQQMNKAANQTDSGRMKALAGTTTALAAKNAGDAVMADPKAAGGVSVSVALGTSKSESVTTQKANWATGSTLNAGRNINLLTTGDASNSHITIQGSTVNAGNNIYLKTEGDINLLAAKNQQEEHTKSSSSSASVGATVGVGSGGASVSVNASVSGSKGKGDGEDITWTNTYLNAGNKLTLESGGDTNLKGAIVNGKQIIANIGGNLNIESLQDSSTYKSEESSYSASVSIPVYGYGTASASFNSSNSNTNSNYASVTEQSGFKAGDGGFQINVKGNTDLIGGIISSTANAYAVNSLATGSLTYRDIENVAEYEASSTSFGGGYSGSSTNVSDPANGGWANAIGNQFGDNNNGPSGLGTNQQGQVQPGGLQTPGTTLPGYNGFSATAPVAMNASDSASSSTRSGISSGAITITDPTKQAQTGTDAASIIAGLNRDVETGKDTTSALNPIFNEQEIKAGFEIVSGLTREVGTFMDNRAKESTDAKEGLKEELGKPKDQQDPQKIAQYEQTLDSNKTWDMGGTGRQIVTALTAAASGNITGSSTQFIQSAAVNYLQSLGAEKVKEIADTIGDEHGGAAGETARTALQGLLACGGAAASGQSCSSGAMGASASVVLNNLIDSVTGDKAGNLTPEEKQARENLLASLITGITASAGGDAAVANAASRIEMENNNLLATVFPTSSTFLPIGGAINEGEKSSNEIIEAGLNKLTNDIQEDVTTKLTLLGYLISPAQLQKVFNNSDKGQSPTETGDAGKTVGDLVKGATPGEETSGRAKQFEKTGGMDQANKDFDSLNPTNVKEINTGYGLGRVGTLPDGRQVVVRGGSSGDSKPTLEIQQGKNRIKIRY